VTDALLAGRVAIVTGASRGIGAATAWALARAGASVVLAARSEAALTDLARQIPRPEAVRTQCRPT
jgi:short-subunit dehydrogenase